MKGYLVDTNVPSELTRERPDARVKAFLDQADKSSIFLSVLTIGEICNGIANLPHSQKRTGLQDWLDLTLRSWFSGRILPITAEIAERWGSLAAAAKHNGITLPVVDGLIGATALKHDLVVVTRNVDHFEAVGVNVLNPWS